MVDDVAVQPSESNILIIDDSRISRLKLTAAVRHLGHQVLEADSGQAGLDVLASRSIQLILLDIVMPGMDGFDVLRHIQQSPTLSEVPVLVISNIDDMVGVVRALDLGAVDFLPKSVDPKLLKARVDGCLEKKRLRDLELAYLNDVARLTSAARIVQANNFNPERLELNSVAERTDSLGDLARVFRQMASDVHWREVAFRKQVDLLKGGMLLILIGVCSGLYPSLSKILMGSADSIKNPLGLTAWVATITMAFGLFIAVISGARPQFSMKKIRFALLIGPLAGAIPQFSLFVASEHVPAVQLSIIMALQALMVFVITASLGIEKPTIRRFSGLLMGMVAVALVIIPSATGASASSPIWIMIAMLAPLAYAIENILLGAIPEDDMTPMQLVFFAMLGSAFWAWLASGLLDQMLLPGDIEPGRLVTMTMIALVSCTATYLVAIAVRKTGAIFASQYGYFATILGVVWSLILLDESVSRLLWLALACMITGMVLVRPRESDEMVALTSSVSEPEPSTELKPTI